MSLIGSHDINKCKNHKQRRNHNSYIKQLYPIKKKKHFILLLTKNKKYFSLLHYFSYLSEDGIVSLSAFISATICRKFLEPSVKAGFEKADLFLAKIKCNTKCLGYGRSVCTNIQYLCHKQRHSK